MTRDIVLLLYLLQQKTTLWWLSLWDLQNIESMNGLLLYLHARSGRDYLSCSLVLWEVRSLEDPEGRQALGFFWFYYIIKPSENY